MSGPKAYTMKEMKGIVEYLVEHRAYSEVKGRKMWTDFANTPVTTRTWQSLKETFIKRILPDIQNPYYNLTRDQVSSFKQGADVEAKEKNNKLEIRAVEESSKNENQNDVEQPSTSAEKCDEAEKNIGENVKSATISARNRSSADTYIIDEDTTSRNSRDDPAPSKKTTEELLAELESPKRTAKTLKECLNFEHSEPPSVVREVLNDFETESEGSDKEPQMEIVLEDTSDDNIIITDFVNQEMIVVDDSENLDSVEFVEDERIIVEGGMEVDIGPTFDHEIITEVTTDLVTDEVQGINNWLKECVQEEQQLPVELPKGNEVDETDVQLNVAKENAEDNRNEPHEETETIITLADSENLPENPKEIENKKSLDNDNNNQNSLSTTSDSFIPNNQELLNNEIKSQKTSGKFNILAPLKDAVSRKRSTSQNETSGKKKKLDNETEPKTNGDAVDKTPPSSNNTEALFEALKNADNPVEDTIQHAQDIDESPQNKNPCLKSVSLFEEQFNTTKYSDSEEDTPIPINKEKITDASVENENQEKTVKDLPPSDKIVEIVDVDPPVDRASKIDTPAEKIHENTVKIDSPMETQHDKSSTNDPPVMKKRDLIVLKTTSDTDDCILSHNERPKERFKHLAQAFGFVPGTSVTAAQRRRSLRSRNRTKSQLNSFGHQESSEWEGSISEPELAAEYISPPRGRRNRHARKYKKPQSGRIVSLDEDGGLFVVHGNKIIPLVKNGKNLTFVTYDSLGCSEEEEESMWRQKYIDEKRKAAELKRQLEQATKARTSRSISPILQDPRNIRGDSRASTTIQKPTELDINKQMNIKQIGDAGKIQITLSKNNEETINLEGHWPQVLPIVQQVMSIFYKPEVTVAPDNTETKQKDISGLVTPIIPIIEKAARKVDDLESEIFKEIEERDKKEKVIDTNITKRKAGRPKKTPSTSSEHSEKSEIPAKRTRRSKQAEQKDKLEAEKNKMAELEPTDNTKDKKQIVIEDRLSVEATTKEPIKTPTKAKVEANKKKLPNQTKEKTASEDTDNELVKTVTIGVIEPRVTRSRKSGNDTDSSTRSVTTRLSLKPKDEEETRYMLPPGPITRRSTGKLTPNKARSPENLHEALQNSIDSTQGYQDSDASPAKVNTTKRKKKVSVTVKKGKRITRRRSFPTLTSLHDMSLESSNSSYFVPKKSKSQSLDSAVYKTESYQILMENHKLSIKKLDVIDETSKSDEPMYFNAVSKDSSDNSNIVIELVSSSNVSLPLSPELSVVENLSISRDIIQNDNHPTINEMQANDNSNVVNNIYNQYLISDVDVSVPLMQQDCEILNAQRPAKTKVNKKQKTPIKVSELLNKVSTVNMSVNNTLSDSLDRKLRDLLLESAKKISNTDKENLMDIDESQVVVKKTRGKKRCSTPRKRSGNKKAKPVIEPVIDEQMESCSHGGRSSCPPVITFIPIDENANNSANVQLKTKPKPRVKKDIIKVKIQRPKITNKGAIPEISIDTSQISVYTDSGINETASISGAFQCNDSVELIHNHSETCLQAKECIGDSIEFVENSKSESIISINSRESLECELLKVMEDVEKLSGVYHRAQNTSEEKSSGEVFCTPTETVYHSPGLSNCSLLTEDLSDEAPVPPTKWYLLSEDDTNNTNMRPEQMTSNTRVSYFSTNLNQLFPITCAVPDLSTISELSKENEGSRKGFDTDTDTRSSDYQSLL